MAENVLNSFENNILHLFPNTNPIYLSEIIDYRSKKILKAININKNNRLTLFSKTLQLLDYYFERLRKRDQLSNKYINIHPADLSQLMLVKEHIESNVNNNVSNEHLANVAGMSLSKFKRLFSQVFGTTPYKYHLETKLEVAMELLLTKQHNCSEVGHIIGYHNLSQFSRAFKKTF